MKTSKTTSNIALLGFAIILGSILSSSANAGHCYNRKVRVTVIEFYAEKGTEPGREEYCFDAALEVDRRQVQKLANNKEYKANHDVAYERDDEFRMLNLRPGQMITIRVDVEEHDSFSKSDDLGSGKLNFIVGPHGVFEKSIRSKNFRIEVKIEVD